MKEKTKRISKQARTAACTSIGDQLKRMRVGEATKLAASSCEAAPGKKDDEAQVNLDTCTLGCEPATTGLDSESESSNGNGMISIDLNAQP